MTKVKCPHCGKELSTLCYIETVRNQGTFNPDPVMIFDHDEDFGETLEITYYCPECNKEIADDPDNAYAFFRGEMKEVDDENDN